MKPRLLVRPPPKRRHSWNAPYLPVYPWRHPHDRALASRKRVYAPCIAPRFCAGSPLTAKEKLPETACLHNLTEGRFRQLASADDSSFAVHLLSAAG